MLCRNRGTRLRAPYNRLGAVGTPERKVDTRELIIGLALVHLLLDTSPAFDGVFDIFLKFFIRRRSDGVKNFQKPADRFLDRLLVPPLHVAAQSDALCDLFVSIRVVEQVVESLGQIVRDKSKIIREKLRA